MWATKQAALAVARRFPQLRRKHPFVAEIELPASATIEQFRRRREHLTAYGDPDTFVQSVIQVEAIDSISQGDTK